MSLWRDDHEEGIQLVMEKEEVVLNVSVKMVYFSLSLNIAFTAPSNSFSLFSWPNDWKRPSTPRRSSIFLFFFNYRFIVNPKEMCIDSQYAFKGFVCSVSTLRFNIPIPIFSSTLNQSIQTLYDVRYKCSGGQQPYFVTLEPVKCHVRAKVSRNDIYQQKSPAIDSLWSSFKQSVPAL